MKSASELVNPWLALPNQAPFVLPADAPHITKFSEQASSPTYHLQLPPLPFQGRPDAPIVVLALNPGYVKADEARHTTPYFLETSFRNYRHDPTLPYPLFFLDPQIEEGNEKGGQYWWHRRLKHLRGPYDDKLLARAILNIQYVPYRSEAYKHSRQLLESQQYGFELVRQAVKRNALIIALRSVRLWKEAVPELEGYPRFYKLSNPRNPVLSAQQLGQEGYQELIAELNKAKQIS